MNRDRDPDREPPDRDSVRRTYDRIAGHFAKTREYPWPEVEAFLDDAPGGGVGLDLGCGNGRHAEPLAGQVGRVVCLDASRELLRVARDRIRERDVPADRVALVTGDAARLPLGTRTVDLAVYVATLHHLPTREGRIASLDELARVLAPGGRALVSAWSTEHDRFDGSEAQCAPESRADDGRETGFDTTIEWTLPGGEVVDRFYHIYGPGEFEADLAASGLRVENLRVSSGNCYARVRP